MRGSRLPNQRKNLFQEIKEECVRAEQKGVKLIKLSIGQPQGPAFLSARTAAAQAVMSCEESMHEYQDNGSPGVSNFAQRFIEAQVGRELDGLGLDFLPIPGIKPMLGLVILASGSFPVGMKVGLTTEPGYPTPRDWCNYLNIQHCAIPLNPENGFRFPALLSYSSIRLLMVNYPNNPSGQIATREWWRDLCGYCQKHNIRLFNDAAYYILSHDVESCALCEVALSFPELSFAEAFSASKVIGNGTGWRIGAIVGSPDFVGDLKMIKGNTDSGFVAPMAAGILATLENDYESILRRRELYCRRLTLLISILQDCGMRLAVKPKAGFFTLWLTPKKAFGEKIQNAQHFNNLMISRTGIVGVHFEPYIRYAVCSDLLPVATDIRDAFRAAEVSY